MDKTKLIIWIACGAVALALVSLLLGGLITGQWPWQNNELVDNYTGLPINSAEQTESTGEATIPEDTNATQGTTSATGTSNEPTIGVEIETPTSGSNSGNSGSSGNGSSGNGGSGNSGGNKTEIDFDDLINAGNKPSTTQPTTPAATQPSTTEPETTEPENTPTQSTTAATTPEEEEDNGGAVKPNPGTDIEVPINSGT